MLEFISELDRWEIIGLFGAFTYTAAYILAALDLVTSKSPYYYLMNMVAAGMVLTSLYVHYNLAAVVIQVFFVSVSLVGLWRHLGKRAPDPGKQETLILTLQMAPPVKAEPLSDASMTTGGRLLSSFRLQ